MYYTTMTGNTKERLGRAYCVWAFGAMVCVCGDAGSFITHPGNTQGCIALAWDSLQRKANPKFHPSGEGMEVA